MKSFKYIGIEVPLNHRSNECATHHLETRKTALYAFGNICNDGEIRCWVLKKYIFDTLVTLVLYGVKVLGGRIPKSTWKEIESV